MRPERQRQTGRRSGLSPAVRHFLRGLSGLVGTVGATGGSVCALVDYGDSSFRTSFATQGRGWIDLCSAKGGDQARDHGD